MKRKLIEVSLPLDDINRESAREKSIRHGHPSTLHLWWARRPLAAARAVLFAQLVDDPSSRPEEFPTEEDQGRERERLHDIIRELVKWENIDNAHLYAAAKSEILKSTDGNPPPILDPFAGGGTIPLEAQRLGLEAHASDLNPVAVLINKALVEIPPKFAGGPPVFPGAADARLGDWPSATGLAEDVRRYGEWMRDEAEKRIGHLYPKATLEDGSEANVIAWIWARTVRCPNPACGIEMPLVRSWWLSKKKGKETFIVPEIVVDGSDPSGNRVEFRVSNKKSEAPPAADGTVGRQGAVCCSCSSSVGLKYVRAQGKAVGLGQQLMAVVAEGSRRREYASATRLHADAARVDTPDDAPRGDLPGNPRDFKTPNYGMTRWADLFTSRQLTALTTFSDLVGDVRQRVLADAMASGMSSAPRLEEGGSGADAYADAVATYLAFAVSRNSNKLSSICTWDSSTKMEAVRSVFSRQALPMSWDFAEANPFASSSGSFLEDTGWVAKAVDRTPASGSSTAEQADAASRAPGQALISTDPPYYDNIGYSDLSDFFYVWLRRSLGEVHPDLLGTMLVPKAEELVANPYRHGGREQASQFFEHGFRNVFRNARGSATDDFPITVWYAFKQTELENEGVTSTGWATVLEGMIAGGWTITATWPVRSELSNRMIASGTNALASSVVLALRPRTDDAPMTDRRGFVAELRAVLPESIRTMQEGGVAAVDMVQAAIGPGMAVFSSYAEVFDSQTGKPLDVRTALTLINQVLGEIRGDTDSDLDADSRWCLEWFKAHGFDEALYGHAETMASGNNISVQGLVDASVIRAGGGKVRLLAPKDLPSGYDPLKDDRVTRWEIVMHLARLIRAEEGGIESAGQLLSHAARAGVNPADVRQLADTLFVLAERRGLNDAAGAFNDVTTSWHEIREKEAQYDSTRRDDQLQLDLEGEA